MARQFSGRRRSLSLFEYAVFQAREDVNQPVL
jgi:hypothetical protein